MSWRDSEYSQDLQLRLHAALDPTAEDKFWDRLASIGFYFDNLPWEERNNFLISFSYLDSPEKEKDWLAWVYEAIGDYSDYYEMESIPAILEDINLTKIAMSGRSQEFFDIPADIRIVAFLNPCLTIDDFNESKFNDIRPSVDRAECVTVMQLHNPVAQSWFDESPQFSIDGTRSIEFYRFFAILRASCMDLEFCRSYFANPLAFEMAFRSVFSDSRSSTVQEAIVILEKAPRDQAEFRWIRTKNGVLSQDALSIALASEMMRGSNAMKSATRPLNTKNAVTKDAIDTVTVCTFEKYMPILEYIYQAEMMDRFDGSDPVNVMAKINRMIQVFFDSTSKIRFQSIYRRFF